MPSAENAQKSQECIRIDLAIREGDRKLFVKGSLKDGIEVAIARTALTGQLYDSISGVKLPENFAQEFLRELNRESEKDFQSVTDLLLNARIASGINEIEGNYFRPNRTRLRTAQLDRGETGTPFLFAEPTPPAGLFDYLENLNAQQLRILDPYSEEVLKLTFPRKLREPESSGEIVVALEEEVYGRYETHGPSRDEMTRIGDALAVGGIAAVQSYVDKRIVRDDSGLLLQSIQRSKSGNLEAIRLASDDGREEIRMSVRPGESPAVYEVKEDPFQSPISPAWKVIERIVTPYYPWEQKLDAWEVFQENTKRHYAPEASTHQAVRELLDELPREIAWPQIESLDEHPERKPRDITESEFELAKLHGYQCLEFSKKHVDTPAQPNSLVLFLDANCEGMVMFQHTPHLNRTIFQFSRETDSSLGSTQNELRDLITHFMRRDTFDQVQRLYDNFRNKNFFHRSGDDIGRGAIPDLARKVSPNLSPRQFKEMHLFAWSFFREYEFLRKEAQVHDGTKHVIWPRFVEEGTPMDPEQTYIQLTLREDQFVKASVCIQYDSIHRSAPYISSFDIRFGDKRESFTFAEKSISDLQDCTPSGIMKNLFQVAAPTVWKKLGLTDIDTLKPLKSYSQFKESPLKYFLDECSRA